MSHEAFWNRLAPRCAKKPVADPDAYAEMLDYVRGHLSKTDRVLEIGCGTGSTALLLADSVAQYTGTDLASEMIRIARAKLDDGAPKNVSFEQAEADAQVDGEPFDAVLASSLLHLVEDLPRVMRQVQASLKPGGLFISKTVCLKHRSAFLRGIVRMMMAVGLAPLVRMLSEEDLTKQLGEAGFEILELTYFDKTRMSPCIVARRGD